MALYNEKHRIFFAGREGCPAPQEGDCIMKTRTRAVLIGLAVIVVLIACYALVFMRVQPLMDCLEGTEAPNAGQIVLYEQDKDPVTLTIDSADQVAGLWQAMENTQVRFLRGRGSVVVPQGGAYYEITLQSLDESGQEAAAYNFGCGSDGALLIVGSDYETVGESDLPAQLEALFAGQEP